MFWEIHLGKILLQFLWCLFRVFLYESSKAMAAHSRVGSGGTDIDCSVSVVYAGVCYRRNGELIAWLVMHGQFSTFFASILCLRQLAGTTPDGNPVSANVFHITSLMQ